VLLLVPDPPLEPPLDALLELLLLDDPQPATAAQSIPTKNSCVHLFLNILALSSLFI
jgi:hypothetical protein